MSRNRMVWIPVLLGCLALAGPAGAAPAQEKPQEKPAASQRSTYLSNYEIRFPRAACRGDPGLGPVPEGPGQRLPGPRLQRGEGGGPRTLLTILEVRTDGETHEKISRALARQDIGPETQTFFLVLLAAGPEAAPDAPAALGGRPEGAPGSPRDSSPTKRYEVLDSTLLRGTRSMNGRLVGRNGLGYDVEAHFQQPGGGRTARPL